jgi:hypothetical protein
MPVADFLTTGGLLSFRISTAYAAVDIPCDLIISSDVIHQLHIFFLFRLANLKNETIQAGEWATSKQFRRQLKRVQAGYGG